MLRKNIYGRLLLTFFRKLMIGCFICTFYYSFGQLNNSFFQDYKLTYLDPVSFNPAIIDTNFLFCARANVERKSSFLRNVGGAYLSVQKQLNGNRGAKGIKSVGFLINSTRLGKFIAKNRLYVSYSNLIFMKNKSSLTAGANLGVINYAFLSSTNNSGGADFAPDASIGLNYMIKNLMIGTSVQQLFKPVLKPVQQSFKLGRKYNLNFNYLFLSNRRLTLSGEVYSQLSEGLSLDVSTTFQTEWLDKFQMSITTFSLRSNYFGLGLKELNVLGNHLTLFVNYNFFNRLSFSSFNSFEVFVSVSK